MRHIIVDEVRYDLFRRVLAAVAPSVMNQQMNTAEGSIGTASLLTGMAVEELLKAGIITQDPNLETSTDGGQSSIVSQIDHLHMKDRASRPAALDSFASQPAVTTQSRG